MVPWRGFLSDSEFGGLEKEVDSTENSIL